MLVLVHVDYTVRVIVLRQGPYVYELYSIMIHSGSAAGGHYYAYIKSFKVHCRMLYEYVMNVHRLLICVIPAAAIVHFGCSHRLLLCACSTGTE